MVTSPMSLEKDENGVPIIKRSAEAIAHVESEGSGGYSAIGPRTKSGDYAYGRYQVMGKNIPLWTKEVLGEAMTPKQFLASQQAQDAVFNAKFGEYVKKYGNVGDAASMWFTGVPFKTAVAQGRTDGFSTVEQYVNKFKTAFGAVPNPKPLTAADPTFGDPQIHVESNYEEPSADQSDDAITDTSTNSNVLGDLLSTATLSSPQRKITPPQMGGIGDMTGGMFGQSEQNVNDIVFGQKPKKPWQPVTM